MKQLKLFLALVFIMGVYSTSLANENDLDPRFDVASNGAVGNPTSLCNSVSEPFYQFFVEERHGVVPCGRDPGIWSCRVFLSGADCVGTCDCSKSGVGKNRTLLWHEVWKVSGVW